MKKQNINPNQLTLWSDHMNEEIDYKNDYVDYIKVDSNDSNIVHKKAVTSNLYKTAKTFTDNIKKTLKTTEYTRSIENWFANFTCFLLPDHEEKHFSYSDNNFNSFFIFCDSERFFQHKLYNNFSIHTPLSHNSALSLM